MTKWTRPQQRLGNLMGAGGRGEEGGGGVSLLGVYKAGAGEDRPLLSGARWPAPSPPPFRTEAWLLKQTQHNPAIKAEVRIFSVLFPIFSA
jgi:hypothetical protein